MREPQVRAGLRDALFMLRRALGDTTALRLEDETVALDPGEVSVDVHDFEQALARGGPGALERAAEIPQGDLLERLVLEATAFEESLIAERPRLRELAIETLARLLSQRRDAGHLETVVQTCLRLDAWSGAIFGDDLTRVVADCTG